jgi:hypothetical protein
MSYIILRVRWCNIIVVNVHAPREDTSDDIKDSFYEELGCVFDQFPLIPYRETQKPYYMLVRKLVWR